MLIARQSTARTVTIGPVLDASGVAVTDGVVADLKISKNGGAPAALNGSATLTHRNTGHYSLALTASDLDTVGQVEIVIDDTVNACPMKEITVVEEVIYDALFAASANAFTGVAGSTALTALAANSITSSVIAANAIGASQIAADAITDAKVASDVTIASVTGAVGSVTGNVGGNVAGSVGSVTGLTASDVGAIKTKTDQLTFTTTNKVDATVPDTQKVDLNTIKTQAVTCAAGVTILASVGTAATSTAQTGDAYAIVSSGTHGNAALKTLIDDLPTNAELATALGTADDAVLAAIGALNDAPDVSSDVAAIKAKTDNLPSDPADASVVAGLIAAVETKVDTIDGIVDAILADTGTDGVVVAAGSKTGYALTSGERDSIAAALLDLANGIETSYPLRKALRLILAASAGKLSGAATDTVSIRDVGDSKNRIVATCDADGNRSAVTLDAD